MKLIDKKQYINIFEKNKLNFIKININSYDYIYDAIITLYQALLQKGWYLPRFCFHSKLSIAGNCRMCFVELKNVNKPIVSCGTNISNNLVVFTNTLLSFKSRESILEFILINHPIDCPICDQGGECDLQDQYNVMGSMNSRFYENFKKSVSNKNISFLIKLSLNKCINCTRCSRFSQQIAGDYTFSLLGRGENSNISNYIKSFYNFEISGNVMDLCPVGALTSKIISYDFRIWELIDLKFIDLFDSMQPPVRFDFRGLQVQRILPLCNIDTEEEWISDCLRYSFKSFFKNRFYLPKIKKNHFFLTFSWINTTVIIKNIYIKLIDFFYNKKLFFNKTIYFDKFNFDIYIHNYYSFFFKKFNFALKNHLTQHQLNKTRNYYFIKNKELDLLEIDNIFLCFLNFRYDYPLFNYRIREKMIYDYINVYVFGSLLNLNYYSNFIGNSFVCFINFFFKLKKKKYMFFFNNEENYLYNFLNLKNINFLNNLKNSSEALINSECGYFKNIILNRLKNVFSFNFSLTSIKRDSLWSLNLLFSQNFNYFKTFKFVLPKKFNFEQNSMFINIFGVFNDFTFISYKSDHKTLKNDWNFLYSLFKKFGFFRKLNLSSIKSKFISKRWVYSYYNFKIFDSIYCFNNDKISNNNFYKNVLNNSFYTEYYFSKLNFYLILSYPLNWLW